jgi:hypothetical protein
MAVSEDVRNHRLVIGQQGADLLVRTRRTEHGHSTESVLRARGVVHPDRWQEVRVSLGEVGALTVDGVEHDRRPYPPVTGRLPQGTQVSLGAEASGQHPWEGRLREVTLAVGRDRHDVLVDGRLSAPSSMWALPTRLDESGTRTPRDHLRTAAWHLVLSFAVGVGLRGSTGTRARPVHLMLGWTVLAAVGNAAKVVIATRHPSLATSLLHLAGGWLGIVTAQAAWSRRLSAEDVRHPGDTPDRARVDPPEP